MGDDAFKPTLLTEQSDYFFFSITSFDRSPPSTLSPVKCDSIAPSTTSEILRISFLPPNKITSEEHTFFLDIK